MVTSFSLKYVSNLDIISGRVRIVVENPATKLRY